MTRPSIAVVGAGIAGLSAAWLLRDSHDVTLFEAEPRAGGHADTQSLSLDGKPLDVDTGFIVFNDRNYPNLVGLFDTLGIATENSEMSFGVSIAGGALEYGGGDMRQLFAQHRNLVRPRFWSMIRDLLRFYREAPRLLDEPSDTGMSLGDWLTANTYGDAFINDHLLPMGAAIWSASVEGMRAFPARHFARFFKNHGLLQLTDRPQWRTVTGGSRRYVAAVTAALPALRLATPITALRRTATGILLRDHTGAESAFDQAILACHADESLALLADATPEETALLGAVPFQDNVAVLHTDAALMPRRRAVWSAWNYLSDGAADRAARISITYWMNRLQNLKNEQPILVSLNPLHPPDPAKILRTRTYRHPQFDAAAMRAQAALPALQGQNRLFFAGAWTGWGFHEDGIASAVRIAALLGVTPPWASKTNRAATTTWVAA
jgi:predicted NAD/FAD-binding protein